MMTDTMGPEPKPWLHSPVQLEGPRVYKCSFKDKSFCAYQQGFWRFWYEDDHRYAVPTVIFFCAGIGLFMLAALLTRFTPRRLKQTRIYRRPIALLRWLSYRSFYVPAFKWNSPPVGVMLLGAVGVVYFFSMMLGPRPYYWPVVKGGTLGGSPPIGTRSGWLSVACLPFVFAMGAKANLVTALTGISHEKLQVFHRWISHAMFVTALVHTFPFIIYHISQHEMEKQWRTTIFYWTGTIAIIAQAWLTFASFAPLRNLCYEFFKFSHFVAGVIFYVFLFLHCNFELTSWDYMVAAAAVYAACFFYAQIRTYFEHGFGRHATSTLASNGFVRVAIPAKSGWSVGQHVFVRFVGLGPHAWTSHPFTICSLPARSGEKNNELVLYIRAQGGFTSNLTEHVKKNKEVRMRVLLDGPYGGIDTQKLDSRDRIIVVAGGSGSGWTLPLVEAFLRRHEAAQKSDVESAKLPSMKVIIATRDLATRCWYKDTLAEILSKYPSVGSSLEVEMYRTSEEACLPSQQNRLSSNSLSEKSIEHGTAELVNEKTEDPSRIVVDRASSSASSDTEVASVGIRNFNSRPDLPTIIAAEAANEEHKSVGVYLCGPHGMQKDVAKAAAAAQLPLAGNGSREVYLHMEHFAWA